MPHGSYLPTPYGVGRTDGQYAKFSDRLTHYFSRNCYYERRRGDRLCSPKEITHIREVLAEIGLPDLEFDAYEERYNFSD